MKKESGWLSQEVKRVKIGEFSRCTGISIATLRYYDKINLLTPKREGMQRVYTEEDLLKVKAIQKLKNINFSLEEIKGILEMDQRLDESMLTGEISQELVMEFCKILEGKYIEILQFERNILEVKRELEHLLSKVKALM